MHTALEEIRQVEIPTGHGGQCIVIDDLVEGKIPRLTRWAGSNTGWSTCAQLALATGAWLLQPARYETVSNSAT